MGEKLMLRKSRLKSYNLVLQMKFFVWIIQILKFWWRKI